MISLRINLIPQPKQRPRVARGRAYTPKATAEYESAISEAASHLTPLEGPLSLEVVFVFPRLKATPKREAGRLLKATRPDLDNLLKALKDGLQGHAFNDDAQITDVIASKQYAALDEEAHIEVKVSLAGVIDYEERTARDQAHTSDAQAREINLERPFENLEAAALRNARRAINQELHRKRQEARWKVSRELRAAAKEEMRQLKLEAARMDHKAQKQAELEERRKRAQNWRGFNGKPRVNWRALSDDDEVS